MIEQRFVREIMEMKNRVLLLSFAVAMLFFLLLLRLWHLQIMSGDDYRDMSENNRLRFLPVAASRGAIMDRSGKVLVSNRPSFSLAVIPQEVKDREALLTRLASLLKLDRDEMAQRWDKGRGKAKYYPIVLASGISRDQVEIIEENRLYLPGVEVEMKPVREYAQGLLAAHLLGYIGEVSEDELNSSGFEDYYPGDYIGKNGVERSWEKELHGSDGGRELEVNARGQVLRTISETYPTPGNSVVLTIEAAVQKQAELAFGAQAGAAVALDVNTGDVLAFVSNPVYDPALFSGKIPADKWKRYLEDKRRPLENKALTGMYPPGSTFKMVTALAGLEAGVIDRSTTVTCRGYHESGSSRFNCWNRRGHGQTNLKKSLRESCDVYYYQLGEKIGMEQIAGTARKMGLGAPLGIGLKNEKGGLIPGAEWKQKRFGKRWFQGDTITASIGQGYVLMTPIQLASMTATLASEGKVYRPRVVKRIVDADGKTVKEYPPELVAETGIPAEHFRLVKQGMLSCVNDPGGTGSMARLYEVKVAGKTGTSQVVKLRDRKGNLPYKFKDHALFVAFAPYDKPEIAVAVVVEHGGGGGSVAAPIAGNILRAYFDAKKPKPTVRPRAEEDEVDEQPEGTAPRPEAKEGTEQ
ncbi:MAG TPA: penicillin-binding protein 2 [Deltaproteobacteria bacterium]|nr:penicillin-binding protein 2 [Deltaproteobacteria bacterium]